MYGKEVILTVRMRALRGALPDTTTHSIVLPLYADDCQDGTHTPGGILVEQNIEETVKRWQS